MFIYIFQNQVCTGSWCTIGVYSNRKAAIKAMKRLIQGGHHSLSYRIGVMKRYGERFYEECFINEDETTSIQGIYDMF